MADIISELASKSGVSNDLAKKGIGAVLSFIEERIPPDRFSNVLHAVPNANSMMAAAEAGQESSAGFFSSVGDLAGKVFGSAGGPASLASKLTQLGFSPEQLQRFIPALIDFLESRLTGDVMNKITALIQLGAKSGIANGEEGE
jgi:hypothetical protein